MIYLCRAQIYRIKIMKTTILLLLFLILFSVQNTDAKGINLYQGRDQGHLRSTHLVDIPDNHVYFKIGQGFSYGRLLDQRMSNLHYTGPGMILSFSRYAEVAHYRSELEFAGIGFQILQSLHQGATVNNPFFAIRYSHLRKLYVRSIADYHIGGQVETFANIRLAPVLSNSFLYADFITTLKPRLDVGYNVHLFDREFNFDFSLAFAIMGYGLRVPEYGASYQIGSSGGEVLTNHVEMFMHPGNYRHFIAGIHYKGRMGRMTNPNRFRIGYLWDYSHIRDKYGHSLYNVKHQLVLEFLFLVN